LSIGYNRGSLEIGKAIGTTIERIPSLELHKHFFRSCEDVQITPKKVAISEINNNMTDMLIALENVQFASKELGASYANANNTNSEDRVVVQLSENCGFQSEINLRNSGFSNFRNQQLPEGKGEIIGVLNKYYSEYQLLIRNTEDVVFTEERCEEASNLQATVSFSELKEMYKGKLVEFGIDTEYVFEGYVISSDVEGNFSEKIVVQDAIENPTGGLQVLVDEELIYEKYEVGDKVLLKLNRLYMDEIEGVLTIGYPKKETIGEITKDDFQNFIINTNANFEIVPREVSLVDLDKMNLQNTLVKINGLQLIANEVGKAFTYYSGTTSAVRQLETCGVFSRIEIKTNGKATFSNEKFPTGNGSIVGVLFGENSKLQIQVRNLEDIFFTNPFEDCPVVEPKIMITEIADPENSTTARFIELYNAGDEVMVLTGWKLNKYLNGANSISGIPIKLTGLRIEPKSFLTIANVGFESVFNKIPNVVTTYITGNGDDVYELVDANGNVQDVYGKVGIDGTGAIWEYVDGKAIRKKNVTEPNAEFDISEWEVFSKVKGSRQNAPQDFNPGVR